MIRYVDAVDEYIERLSEDDSDAAVFVAAYESNEELIQTLIEARESAGVSQRQLAKTMGTSASVVVHLEAGHSDPRQSTIARYAASLHKVVRWELIDFAIGQPATSLQAERAAPRYVAGDRDAILASDPFLMDLNRYVTDTIRSAVPLATGAFTETGPFTSSLPSTRLAA